MPRLLGTLLLMALCSGVFANDKQVKTTAAANQPAASEPLINGLTPRQFLDRMVVDCFTAPTKPMRDAVDQYFTQDYRHVVDGKPITREQHIAHLEFYQKNTDELDFKLQQVVFDGEWLAERHFGRAKLKSGRVIESEVSTFFRIVDGKIAESHEITRPLSGLASDRDIHTGRDPS